jgi:type II secretory pathway component GspD/PulD (secretin)
MPALADVPGLADLFTQEKKQTVTNHLLVIATTQVINAECEECCKTDPILTKLLDAYGKACKSGKVDEARRLAIECLAIDPTCFGKR